MQIRIDQFDALESNFRERRRLRIFQAIRVMLGDVRSEIGEGDALRLVDEGIEDGKSINIIQDEDLVRFTALAFLPQSTLSDPFVASALIRILNRDNWPAKQRLDFIYRHVIANVVRPA